MKNIKLGHLFTPDFLYPEDIIMINLTYFIFNSFIITRNCLGAREELSLTELNKKKELRYEVHD